MAKKKSYKLLIFSIIFIFLLAIVGIISYLIVNGNPLGTIFSPDLEANAIVNKYYFPINNNILNGDRCTNINVNYGANFIMTSSTLPTSLSSCMFAEKQSFIFSRSVRSQTGSCSDLGKEVTISGDKVFKYFITIKQGSNYLLCKNNLNGGYGYSLFIPSSTLCRVTYTNPVAEKEGRYYCNGKSIYLTPCDGKPKTLIKSCTLGCEYATKSIEQDGSTQVVKCKGDYEPSKTYCTVDGTELYKTDSQGTATIQDCCGCSNGICKACPTPPSCQLVYGGSGDINIFLYNYTYTSVDSNFPNWIKDELTTRVPFSEFTYNIYVEGHKNDCAKTVPERLKDVRIGFEKVGNYIGWTIAPSSSSGIGIVQLKPEYKSNRWDIIFFHELGHYYRRAGHTTDGSIMQTNLGNGQFTQSQIDIMRRNLQDNTAG